MKPSFIIIGGVKCASSSLYRYINFHPQVLPCKTKEPGYFNTSSRLKLFWKYKSYIDLFPKLNDKQAVGDWLDLGEDNKMIPSSFTKSIDKNKEYITGEATANTFALANPKWIKMMLPNVKLILLLRDPADRFISHFNMLKRFHSEGRKGYDLGTLDLFVDQEIKAYEQGEKTRIISQGIYMDKLPLWKQIFGDNLELFKTKDFNGALANETMNKVCKHLDIPTFDFNPILKVKYNSTGKKMEPTLASEKLKQFYSPSLDQLKLQYGFSLD